MTRWSRFLVLTPLVLAHACTSYTRTGAAVTAGGAVLSIAGASVIAKLESPGVDRNHDGVEDLSGSDLACALGGCALGWMLVGSGLLIGVTGLFILSRGGPPLEPSPPPSLGPPGAPAAHIDSRLTTRLPEMPCDARTLRLARQARLTARQGKCDATRRTLDRIRQRDPRYAAALLGSHALGPCRQAPWRRPAPGAPPAPAPVPTPGD